MSAHCATGDWEDEIARINLIISRTDWKGTGPITLTLHCNTHRDMNGFDSTCVIHVTDPNLPLERQTVYNLVESISTTSPEILADLPMIRFKPSLRNSFEKLYLGGSLLIPRGNLLRSKLLLTLELLK